MTQSTDMNRPMLFKEPVTLPLVSVLMATYNRRNRLIKAIESVRAQTYPHWELCLVCDGGKPVDDIVKYYNDPRIVFKHNLQNKGYGHTANTAFSLSKGAYIAYLGDDDMWMPEHLESLVTALLKQKEASFAYANSLCVRRRKEEDGTFTVIDDYLPCYGHVNLEDILEVNQITGICTLHERALFEKAGGFDEKLRCLVDYDLWRRMLCFTNTIYVNETTSLYYEDLECANDHLTNLATKDPLRYKLQRLRIYNKTLPNGMEERFKHTVTYLRRKYFSIYLASRRAIAHEQGDTQTEQLFSKILAKRFCAVPAGKYVDVALFLMQDKEMPAALRLFKDYLAASQNGAKVYFAALECAIACKDSWASEVFQALWQSKDKLQPEEQQHLETLALQVLKIMEVR